MPAALAVQKTAPETRRLRIAGVMLSVIVVLAAATVVDRATRLPARVPRIEIVNPHGWHANVRVAGRAPDRHLDLGTAERQSTTHIDEVIDQEEVWRFGFSYGGIEGGGFVMSRDDLDAARWRVIVPEAFAARMRAAGIGDSAR